MRNRSSRKSPPSSILVPGNNRRKYTGNKNLETNGKCNTKFFHQSVVQTRQRSRLSCLKKETGQYVETRKEMEEELINYFGTIMKEDRVDRSEHISKITQHMPSLVTLG